MNKILALVATSVLALTVIFSAGMSRYEQRQTFINRATAASGALFVGKDRQFDCSGTEIGHSQGDGIFLTARHCIANVSTDKINKPIQVSFSANEGGPFYDAVPVALSIKDDLAVLLLKNGAGIPEVHIADGKNLKYGADVFNISFPAGVGKTHFHGNYIQPRFSYVPADLSSQYPQWLETMPVQITIAPGSSGSGLFSPDRKALVGVMVGDFHSGEFAIAVPSDVVIDFLAHLKDNTVTKYQAAHPEHESTEGWF